MITISIKGSGRRSRSRSRRGGMDFVIGLATVVLLVLLWQGATVLVNFPYFPPPTAIAENMALRWLDGHWYTLWLGPLVATEILPSIVRMLLGWSIAVVVGVIAGFAIGLLHGFARYVEPIMTFLRNLPPAALIPVFLLILGVGDGMKVVFIASTVIWPIILNTIDGVGAVDQTQLSTGRAYGISRRRVLLSIILPSALPKIFAALRISLSLALILMVISEMVAATNGIGFEILYSQRTFRIIDMWSGIVVLSFLGFILNQLIGLAENRALRWHRGAHGNE